MKTIICGGRDIFNYALLLQALDAYRGDVTEVVSGACTGVDHLGELWARENNIPISYFPADWNLHGKSAGPIRNSEMAAYADAMVALWDSESVGTADMLKKAINKKIDIFAMPIREEDKAMRPISGRHYVVAGPRCDKMGQLYWCNEEKRWWCRNIATEFDGLYYREHYPTGTTCLVFLEEEEAA